MRSAFASGGQSSVTHDHREFFPGHFFPLGSHAVSDGSAKTEANKADYFCVFRQSQLRDSQIERHHFIIVLIYEYPFIMVLNGFDDKHIEVLVKQRVQMRRIVQRHDALHKYQYRLFFVIFVIKPRITPLTLDKAANCLVTHDIRYPQPHTQFVIQPTGQQHGLQRI